MANTTNFGWETPDDTDLVKDGAAAMRTLGNAIDASFIDLKGGTSGQVLTKNSNTDLDYIWSSVDPLTILDAKGDLITATAADTPARLAVGTNGTFLQADSTTATGLKWGSIALNPKFDSIGSANLSGGGTATVNFGSRRANNLFIYIVASSPSNAATTVGIRFNGNSGAADYTWHRSTLSMPTTYTTTQLTSDFDSGSSYQVGKYSSNAASLMNGGIFVSGCNNSTGIMMIESQTASTAGGGNSGEFQTSSGYTNFNGPVTSVSIIVSAGTFDSGTIRVYGDQG